MRKGGGIGFIAVLIAAAIVMILAMRSWISVAPTAQQIMNPAAAKAAKDARARRAGPTMPDHGDARAAAAVRSGNLPDLQDMKDGTDQHAKDVQKALDETNH